MILNKYKIANSKVFVNRIQESKNVYLFIRKKLTFGYYIRINKNFATIEKKKIKWIFLDEKQERLERSGQKNRKL